MVDQIVLEPLEGMAKKTDGLVDTLFDAVGAVEDTSLGFVVVLAVDNFAIMEAHLMLGLVDGTLHLALKMGLLLVLLNYCAVLVA